MDMDAPYSDLSVSKRFFCTLYDKKEYAKVATDFSALETNVERVNYMFDVLKKYNFLPELSNKQGKSNTQSKAARSDGNCSYNFNPYEAIIHYTQAIAYGENHTIDLAKGYAKRSTILYDQGYYHGALMDIERAINHNYPDHLIEKLLLRKSQCLELLDVQSIPPNFWEVPEIEDSLRHPSIGCATNSIQITTNRWHGRGVAATKQIQIGEIIAIEAPYMFNTSPDRFLHCDYCCAFSYTLIPCRSCPIVMYCNDECRRNAFESYHRFECVITATLGEINEEVSSTLPLRVILKAFTSGDVKEQPRDRDVFKSDRFEEIRKLSGNIEKRTINSQMCCSIEAAIIYHLLSTCTNFFELFDEPDLFKELFLELFYICTSNSTCVRERTKTAYKTIAFAVYSFASLLNHSCRPNVVFNFHGPKLIVRACRTIEPGQECFVNYIPVEVAFADPSTRDSFLNTKYLFSCDCKSCLMGHFIDLEDEMQTRTTIKRLLKSNLKRLSKASLEAQNKSVCERHIGEIVQKLKQHESEHPHGEDTMHMTQDMLLTAYSYIGNIRRPFK